MKALSFLFILLLSGGLYAQPSQLEIPDYVLEGKTASELELMRNEIYAKYGLVFKSEKLKSYFIAKAWYTPKYENVDSYLTSMDKKNIELILAEEKNLRADKYVLLYKDETKASIKKYRNPEYEDAYVIKSTKVDFFQTYNRGVIKTISEATDYGGEGKPTVIYAETVDPEIPYWSTTKYCHQIVFDAFYYQTTLYSCCATEDYHEFYNYNSEVPFLKTNEKYFIVEIPNAGIDLFIGYNHRICNREDLTVAELSLATADGLINSIKFKAKNLKDYEDIEAFWSPEIELVSKFPQNEVVLGNRMTVWSKNFEKDLTKISDFSIRITYKGAESGLTAIYEIPIENGLLNGTSKEQLITIDLKK